MSKNHDAIVVLSHGTPDAQGYVDFESLQRVETGVRLYEAGIAEFVVMTGNKSFFSRGELKPQALAMMDAAIDLGVPEQAIITETQSLDTVGNAYFTKKRVLEPKDWHSIAIVTTPSHLPRAGHIFSHVLGADYEIDPVPSSEAPRKAQFVYEKVGLLLEHLLLDGTKSGDDEAIWLRMQAIVPGYGEEGKMASFVQLISETARQKFAGRMGPVS